jgi:hypothetical protein
MNARIGLLSVVLLMIPLLAVAQEEPLALLMAQEGEVTIMRGADAMTREFGMHLDLGDEIRTGLDSSADILFATGQALKLGANGSLVVQTATGETGGAAPSGSATVGRLITLTGSRGTSGIGRVRGESSAEIIAVSPRHAARLHARPVFRWSGGSESGELQVTVEHEGQVHWQGKISGANSLEYPADAPDFVGGNSYSWRVKTVDPLALSAAESQTAFFKALTDGEEAELDATLATMSTAEVGLSTRAVMMAGVLFEHGLVDEAIETIDGVIEGSPDAAGLESIREHLRGANWP